MYKLIDAVGNTPLIELSNISKKYGLHSKILAKLEAKNPTGSAKDRVAKAMIADAENSGKITAGATIIEPTSGNTGIGLAAIGTSLGYKVILTMPDTMSPERVSLIKAYGAEVVLTPGKLGMDGAVKKANELHEQINNSIIAGQFTNPVNPKAHFETTGPEIWNDTDGKVDAFIAAIGTGGTLCGTAKFLKSKNERIEIIGVEPTESPLITKGISGSHGIQGIGANFVPENYDGSVVDNVVTVCTESAMETTKMLAETEGLLCGISSGAALCAAIEYAKKHENGNKTVVVILPDAGDRYMSSGLFD